MRSRAVMGLALDSFVYWSERSARRPGWYVAPTQMSRWWRNLWKTAPLGSGLMTQWGSARLQVPAMPSVTKAHRPYQRAVRMASATNMLQILPWKLEAPFTGPVE